MQLSDEHFHEFIVQSAQGTAVLRQGLSPMGETPQHVLVSPAQTAQGSCRSAYHSFMS
jgi:hypothetical protein